MTARFAGSRTLDERRRRRIATESGSSTTVVPDRVSATAAEGDSGPDVVRPTRFPLEHIIPPSRWKVWGAVLLLVLLTAAVQIGTTIVRPMVSGMPLPIGGRVLTAAARLSQMWTGGVLLLCAQLSVLIWWARSRSLRDFDGMYRVWGWVTFSFLTAAAFVVINGPVLCEAVAELLVGIAVWRKAILCWLLPVTCWGSVLWSVLFQELKSSRTGTVLLWLGAWVWVIGGGWHVLSELPVDRVWQRVLFHSGLVLIASALLHHARFVIHVSPEPPHRRRRHRAKSAISKSSAVPTPKGRATTRKTASRSATSRAKKATAKKTPTTRSTTAAKSTTAKKSTTRKTTAKKTTTRKTATATKAASSNATAAKTAIETKTEAAKKPVATEPQVPEKSTTVMEAPPETVVEQPAPVSEPQPKRVEPVAAETPEPKPAPPETKSSSTAATAPTGQKTYRVDGPDPEMLKGLSKKERRRVRREWKQKQREENTTS